MGADWADIASAMLSADAGTRADLQLAICTKIARGIGELGPATWRGPDKWRAEDDKFIRSLTALAATYGKDFNYEAFRVSAEASDAFMRWRTGVQDFEASEAGKLTTVVWTYQTLYRLRDRSPAPAAVDRMATVVADGLQKCWRLSSVPLEGEYRDWAVRSTRRYDLLPKTWRYV